MQGAIPERKIPLKENNKPAKRVDIGGQAVLEGVMMRSPEYIALAVRRPDGSVVCKRDPYVSPAKKHKWMGWPFVRGAVSMVTMLGTGMKTLEESSKMGGVEDEQPTKFELWLAKKLGKGVDKVVMGLAIVLAVCLSVGLFVLIPNAIIKLFPTTATGGMLLLKNLVTGLVRTAILLGYMAFCRSIPDMKRVFRYHGAEHKTVYCHEADLPLTPENARPFTTLHPRCGTSFLLIVVLLSILVGALITSTNTLLRIVLKLLLLPVVMGVGYEIIKFCGRHDNALTRAVSAPGLWLQHITTNEPDDSMIECAIAAVLPVLPEDPDEGKW